jgi:hypothetical protein
VMGNTAAAATAAVVALLPITQPPHTRTHTGDACASMPGLVFLRRKLTLASI